jgi:hypothetical protein
MAQSRRKLLQSNHYTDATGFGVRRASPHTIFAFEYHQYHTHTHPTRSMAHKNNNSDYYPLPTICNRPSYLPDNALSSGLASMGPHKRSLQIRDVP